MPRVLTWTMLAIATTVWALLCVVALIHFGWEAPWAMALLLVIIAGIIIWRRGGVTC